MKYSDKSENKSFLILKKAEKDLLKLANKYPAQYLQIEALLNLHLKLPVKIDGDRIKYFGNYQPPLYELRIFGQVDFRAFFRVYEDEQSIELERVVPKHEAEKVLKNYFGSP